MHANESFLPPKKSVRVGIIVAAIGFIIMFLASWFHFRPLGGVPSWSDFGTYLAALLGSAVFVVGLVAAVSMATFNTRVDDVAFQSAVNARRIDTHEDYDPHIPRR